VLQKVQKSPEGWQLAESLLSNPDEKIKFFGALTFIVKLNTVRYERYRPQEDSGPTLTLPHFTALVSLMRTLFCYSKTWLAGSCKLSKKALGDSHSFWC
jgi:hypothetical protein